MPLVAILVLDATAFEVAALGVVLFLPFILFTLPAGVWVDRLPRRPILIVGDFGRAALLATVPIAYFADALTLAQLFVVAFLVGTLQVFFDVAYQSYLPSIVEREQIIDGNSKLEISRSAAQVGGPGLGGVLVQVFTAPYAVLLDAFSFVGSGLFLLLIRKTEEPPAVADADGQKPSQWTDLKEGLHFVLGNPNLRAQAGCTATSNFFGNVAFATLLVFAVRELGLSAGVIGIIFSLGAAGSLAAALTATRISARFGIGPTSIVVAALFGPDDASRRPGAGRKRGDSSDRRLAARLRVHDRRLQHRPGELPPGDMSASAPGSHELGDALHGLGHDPVRRTARRCACNMDRPARDDRRRRRRRRARLPLAPALAPTSPAGDARADRRHARSRRSPRKRYRHCVPELPEVEAWVRELDPLVSRSPIEKAGPAHIATLKTAVPPLSELDGRRFEGARRRGKNLLFPIEDADLVLRVHLMSAGRLRYLSTGEKKPKTPMFRLRFTGGDELILTEGGKKKRAGVWLVTQAQLDDDLGHLGPDALGLDAAALGEILKRDRRQLHPLLRDQRAIAGIGRAHSNEILLRARLSPFKASTELSDEEIERLAAAMHEDLDRALELREQGKGDSAVYRIHNRLGEPCPQCGTPIARVDFEEHTIYYCPSCQTGGRLLKDRRLSRLLR